MLITSTGGAEESVSPELAEGLLDEEPVRM